MMTCPDHGIARVGLACVAVVLGTGCPAGDDAAAGTEGETETGSSTGASADGVDDGDDGVDVTTGSNDGSTGVADTTDDGGSSSDADESSSGGGMTNGVCVGVDQVGDILLVLGLEGANPGGNCNATPAGCGGDVVGSWTFENTCGQDSIPNPLDCAGSTFTVTVDDQTGTLDFVDDGTFMQSIMTTQTVDLEVDTMACYAVDCATFEATLQADDPDWACTENGSDCRCALTSTASNDIAGTYTTADDLLTLTVDGQEQELVYCRGNTRLDLWRAVLDATVTREMCMSEADCVDALADTHEAYVCFEDEG